LTQKHRNSKKLQNNNKNDYIQTFLQGLTPTESIDYSLSKVTKQLKQVKKKSALRTSQGTWAKSNIKKAHAFTEHLVFRPHPSEINSKRK
jgi:hypothetical protein